MYFVLKLSNLWDELLQPGNRRLLNADGFAHAVEMVDHVLEDQLDGAIGHGEDFISNFEEFHRNIFYIFLVNARRSSARAWISSSDIAEARAILSRKS